MQTLARHIERLTSQVEQLQRVARESGRTGETCATGLDELARSLRELSGEISGRVDRIQNYLNVAGVTMVALDAAQNVIQVNPKACEMLEANEAEILGRNWFDGFVPPPGREELKSVFRRAVSGEIEMPLYIESTVLTRTGGQRTIGWHSSLVRDETGKVIGSLILGEDITARKQAEGQRDRLVHAVEQAGEAIILTDAQGVIQFVNPAFGRITGYSPQEAIGRNPRFLKSGKHSREFYEALWGTLNSGQIWHGRMTNRRKDGVLYEADSTISPVLDASGKIVSFVEIQRDVSGQVELESRLRQAAKMEAIGRLAGGIAHDFNNQLTVIKGYCDVLLQELPPEGPRESVAEIRSAAERSAALTGQLLSFSRKQMLRPAVVNLNDVLVEISRTLGRLIGEQVRLSLVYAADLGSVEVDPGQLQQAIMNLVLNARDAMPKGGTLTIETANLDLTEKRIGGEIDVAPGPYVMLAISDTGIGMDKETLRRIFDPFYTTKGVGKGTGLGLSVVHGFVKQSGGRISVYSEPGHGTTFRIYLPRLPVATAACPAVAPEEKYASGSETILVVEDEETVRQLVVRLLKDRGWLVLEAADAQRAAALSESFQGRIDLLITDVIMPGMQGPELAARLKARRPEMKVLYITGYAHQATLEKNLDGECLLTKPFGPAALSRKVRSMLCPGPVESLAK